MGLVPTPRSIIGQFINGRNAKDDYLQLADNHGGNIFGWIDSDGHLQGTLATSNEPSGSNTDVQVNYLGSIYGDSGFTYNPVTQAVGGLAGLLITPSFTTAPTLTIGTQGTAGVTSYTYAVVAIKGNLNIAVSALVTLTTGNAALSGLNYNTLAWTAVPGAESYTIWRTAGGSTVGVIATGVLGLSLNDTGLAAVNGTFITAGGPSADYPYVTHENGWVGISTGLAVTGGGWSGGVFAPTCHFGDPNELIDVVNGDYGAVPPARFEFIDVGAGRSINTGGHSSMSIVANNGPFAALGVQNNISGSYGSLQNVGIWVGANSQGVTTTNNTQAVFGGCSVTGSTITGDDGGEAGIVAPFRSESESHSSSINYLLGYQGVTAVQNSTITNQIGFRSIPWSIDGMGDTSNVTNQIDFRADSFVGGIGTTNVTNAIAFYAQNKHIAGATLSAAFYADDQGTVSGAWAVYTAGQTPSLFGGNTTLANPIAATSLLNQSSPSLIISGNYWTGSATAVDKWVIQDGISTGSNPGASLSFTHTGSPAGGGIIMPALTLGGNLTVGTSGSFGGNVLLYGNTPATSLANVTFGSLVIAGNYWTGSVSAEDSWTTAQTLGTGSNPTSTFTISHTGTSGTVTAKIAGLTFPQPAAGVTTPTLTQTIASGSQALGTTLIASGGSTAFLNISAPGVLTTDNIMADFNSDPTSTTGYEPSASGMLTIIKFPTAGYVNFYVVNNTGASITPGAVTINWRVVR
jgi:hypothetical protein